MSTPVPLTTEPPSLQVLAVPAEKAARLLGISRSQWWKLHSQGKIPPPVRLGTKTPRWNVAELQAWLAAGCPPTPETQEASDGK